MGVQGDPTRQRPTRRPHERGSEYKVSGPAGTPPTVQFPRTASPPERGPGRQTLTALDPQGHPIGQIDFQICHACRHGYIRSIAVALHWQGLGIAREALHHVLALDFGGAYTWSATRQTADGRHFFVALEEETKVVFPPHALQCPHMLTARRTPAEESSDPVPVRTAEQGNAAASGCHRSPTPPVHPCP
ncbi:GNAT family N-acetyltransferase [Streptomyces alboflavus]|uniref:GNAT family N-acetyltransferase n=1 Tax=Streptomyces alboflavus TaxID=67267 RepID=UPI0036BF9A74